MQSFKKTVAALAIAGLLAAPAAASAQTSTSSIQALLAQIAALQAQINAAQQQQNTLIGELVVSLKQGNRGENVRLLQQMLAQDLSIYPEGTISGFYGRLTAQAVKRFQKKHGIEQVGNVGPKTLKKLNEIFAKMGEAKGHDDDDDDNDDDDHKWGQNKVAICHKPSSERETKYVPQPAVQGHIVHGDTMGACGGGTGTTTPDTMAPIISAVSAGSVATTTASITWTTNESASSKVYFGTVNPLVLGSASTMTGPGSVISHTVGLSSLTASTTYYFIVESMDAANNVATSSQMIFTTTN